MDRQELSDVVWERIVSPLPGKATDLGRTGRDNRLFVEAILWMARSGGTLAGSSQRVWPVADRLSTLQPLVPQRRLGESFQGLE